jgi:hypothetical protein
VISACNIRARNCRQSTCIAASRRYADSKTLAAIKMPNRDKFVGDPRPPTSKIRPHDRLLSKR